MKTLEEILDEQTKVYGRGTDGSIDHVTTPIQMMIIKAGVREWLLDHKYDGPHIDEETRQTKKKVVAELAEELGDKTT